MHVCQKVVPSCQQEVLIRVWKRVSEVVPTLTKSALLLGRCMVRARTGMALLLLTISCASQGKRTTVVRKRCHYNALQPPALYV